MGRIFISHRNIPADADAIIASMKRVNPSYERAVICIDQAEELLDEEGSFFFDVLRSLLGKRRGRIVVLATMRSDFLNEFQKERLIGPEATLAYDTMALDPLPDDHLSAIIRQPAELFGVTYEDKLFARICEDHKGPDALPLLAFFLDEFWRSDFIRDGVLQLSEYKEFGGVGQALEKAKERAIEECARLEPAHADRQVLLDEIREVFLGLLVSVNESSGAAVRNRARAAALTERQAALLSAFANQRLLIRKDDAWEVVHEALLRQWEDLAGWISDAREDLVAIARIEASAANWIEAERNDSDLTHRGDRLEKAVEMLASPRYAERFDETARAYIEACQAKETERQEREKKHLEEVERERDRARKNQRLGLAALSSSELQAGRAAEASYLALAAWPRCAEPTDNLSDYDVVLDPLADAYAQLREERRIMLGEGPKGIATRVAFSPDGALLATGMQHGEVLVWDLASGNMVSRMPCESFSGLDALAFSPDGSLLAADTYDVGLCLWDVKTGEAVLTLEDQRMETFSPDGTLIVSKAGLWGFRITDIASGREVLTREDERLQTFSPDGKLVVTNSWDSPVIDIATGEKTWLTGIPHNGDLQQPVEFSVDWRRVIIAKFDEWQEWELEPARLIATMPRRDDGDRIKGAIDYPEETCQSFLDGKEKAWLWDMTLGRARREQKNLPSEDEFGSKKSESPSTISSPGGRLVARWNSDGRTCIYDVEEDRVKLWLDTKMEGTVTARHSCFSPDGTRWASVSLPTSDSAVGMVRLWDVTTALDQVLAQPDDSASEALKSEESGSTLTFEEKRAADEELEAAACKVVDIAVSLDGRTVAAVIESANHTKVRLWDITKGFETIALRLPVDPEKDRLYRPRVKLSPDARYGVVRNGPESSRLVDLASGAEILELEGQWVNFTQDGKELVILSHASIRVIDISTGETKGALYNAGLLREEYFPDRQLRGLISAFDMSPDGSRFIIGENEIRLKFTDTDIVEEPNAVEPQVRLWDAKLMREIAKWPLPENDPEGVHNGYPIFFPCGTMIAVALPRKVKIFEAETGKELASIATHDEPSYYHSTLLSPEGERLAVSGTSGYGLDKIYWVALIDIATGRDIFRSFGKVEIESLAFSHDGRNLFVGYWDGSIRIWNVDFGPGNLFDLVYQRLPIIAAPVAAANYGIDLDDIIYSGEEPVPNYVPAFRAHTGKERRVRHLHQRRARPIAPVPPVLCNEAQSAEAHPIADGHDKATDVSSPPAGPPEIINAPPDLAPPAPGESGDLPPVPRDPPFLPTSGPDPFGPSDTEWFDRDDVLDNRFPPPEPSAQYPPPFPPDSDGLEVRPSQPPSPRAPPEEESE